MKIIKFKDQNIILGEDQPEYIPLPALSLAREEGDMISCWKVSFRERVKLLFTGVIWLNIWTFHKPFPPVKMTVNRKEVYHHPDDLLSFFTKVNKWINHKFDRFIIEKKIKKVKRNEKKK